MQIFVQTSVPGWTRSDIIIRGGSLDDEGEFAGVDLYALSEECELGDCDAFVSHSWKDDGVLKWAALTRWCEEFELAYGRTPRFWLDKRCSDQSDIAADLRCLPIFLSGCNNLVIFSGESYTSRL